MLRRACLRSNCPRLCYFEEGECHTLFHRRGSCVRQPAQAHQSDACRDGDQLHILVRLSRSIRVGKDANQALGAEGFLLSYGSCSTAIMTTTAADKVTKVHEWVIGFQAVMCDRIGLLFKHEATVSKSSQRPKIAAAAQRGSCKVIHLMVQQPVGVWCAPTLWVPSR